MGSASPSLLPQLHSLAGRPSYWWKANGRVFCFLRRQTLGPQAFSAHGYCCFRSKAPPHVLLSSNHFLCKETSRTFSLIFLELPGAPGNPRGVRTECLGPSAAEFLAALLRRALQPLLSGTPESSTESEQVRRQAGALPGAGLRRYVGGRPWEGVEVGGGLRAARLGVGERRRRAAG